jgi:hypothetical protein
MRKKRSLGNETETNAKNGKLLAGEKNQSLRKRSFSFFVCRFFSKFCGKAIFVAELSKIIFFFAKKKKKSFRCSRRPKLIFQQHRSTFITQPGIDVVILKKYFRRNNLAEKIAISSSKFLWNQSNDF